MIFSTKRGWLLKKKGIILKNKRFTPYILMNSKKIIHKNHSIIEKNYKREKLIRTQLLWVNPNFTEQRESCLTDDTLNHVCRINRYIDINEVSELCSISKSTLRRNVQKGSLKCSQKLGKMLFKVEDVERWLNG